MMAFPIEIRIFLWYYLLTATGIHSISNTATASLAIV